MKTWLIYKHTNTVTGKSYIGQTCYSMKTRWVKHCSDARVKPVSHFHKSIAKHGENVWDSCVLKEDIQSLEEANKLEEYYIAKFNTYESGYNSTLGGDSDITNEKTIAKITKRIREYHNTKQVQIYNIKTGECKVGYPGDLEKELGFSQGSLGDVVYEYRKSHKNWVLLKNKEYKPINRYWFMHKELGTDYCTLDEMCRKYPNITSRGNLSGVIYGTRKSHQGWELITKDKK